MSRTAKNILIVIGAILVTACLIAVHVAGTSARKPLVCKGLQVTISDSASNSFISREDVRSLDLDRIEQVLESKSAINRTEAFVTKDGMLNITITQRRPVVRFQGAHGGYYADAEGRSFALQKSYASYVPVVDGKIPAITDTVGIVRTTQVVNFLENDALWKGKFVQIRIDDKGDIILIPREGNERFIIGQPCKIEEKARKMEWYYTHIIPEKGGGHYKTVDLRFDGQIVCR